MHLAHLVLRVTTRSGTCPPISLHDSPERCAAATAAQVPHTMLRTGDNAPHGHQA